MQIKIPVKLIRDYLKKHPDEDMLSSLRFDGDDRTKEYDIDDFTDAQLDTLVSLAEKDKVMPGAKGLIQKIKTYKNIKVDPAGRQVRRLEDLEQALRLYCAKWTNHWAFVDLQNNVLPYYITAIDYTPYDDESETPASCAIRFMAISRGDNESHSMTWHSEDLNEGKTCAQLLAEQFIYMPTPKLLADYEKTLARYKAVKDKMGEQFTGDGEGRVVKNRWDRGTIALVRDGMAAKLVMDDNPQDTADDDDDKDGKAFGDDNGLTKDSYWRDASTKEESGHIALPVHPFVQLFDLDRHGFVIVNSNQLTEYAWNPAIGDKLILAKEHKDVITILMDTANEEIADIIAGKSGGTIIISTGDPGTGKTLTAEVTSEVTKRPLYKVQCSQLGTDEEEIEKKLSKVLARAIRWKAILLIDEADVYVRERGNDIQQNAIVGVFLRVLEYYRGILFLTSNRATIIDDAIMSRATAHLKYQKPTDCELAEIWRVLSTQFGLKLPGKMIDELCQTFPGIVGRDVKNLLKLAIRYTRRNESKVTVDLFKLLSIHKDITPKAAPFQFTETSAKNENKTA